MDSVDSLFDNLQERLSSDDPDGEPVRATVAKPSGAGELPPGIDPKKLKRHRYTVPQPRIDSLHQEFEEARRAVEARRLAAEREARRVAWSQCLKEKEEKKEIRETERAQGAQRAEYEVAARRQTENDWKVLITAGSTRLAGCELVFRRLSLELEARKGALLVGPDAEQAGLSYTDLVSAQQSFIVHGEEFTELNDLQKQVNLAGAL